MPTITTGSNGRAIRIYRVARDLTQQAVGARAHLSQKAVSMLERGERRLRPDLAARLLRAIDELSRERPNRAGGDR